MTRVLGISNIQNGGKSHLINKMSTLPRVKVYEEIARKLFPILENYGMDKFQEYINALEFCRHQEILRDIQSGLYDVIITDRTSADNEFFAGLQNTDQEKHIDINHSIYDEVILLNTPIGDSSRFEEYNNKVEPFNDFIREKFGDKVTEFKNYLDDEDIIDKHILG